MVVSDSLCSSDWLHSVPARLAEAAGAHPVGTVRGDAPPASSSQAGGWPWLPCVPHRLAPRPITGAKTLTLIQNGGAFDAAHA